MEISPPESSTPLENPSTGSQDGRLEKFAQRISRVAGVGGWEVDLRENSVYWSAETARIHDCPEGYQLALQEGLDFYTEESIPIITKAVEECMSQGKDWDLELTIRTAKGRIRWVNTIGEAEFVGGQAVRLFGTFQDITEWVELRLQAQQEKERMKSLITHLRAGLVVMNAQARHLSVNPAFEQMSGFTEAELLGTAPPFPYWDPEQLPTIEAAFARTLAGDFDSFELPFRRKNGEPFWAEITPTCWRGPDGEVAEFFATVIDITERRRMTMELRESRDQFSSLVDNIPGTAFRCLADNDWTVLYMSRSIDEISGYPVSDFLNNAVRSYASVILPADQEAVSQSIFTHLEKRQPWEVEYRVQHRDGSIRWVCEKGQGVWNEQDQLLYLDGFLSDITSHKEAEEALAVEQTLFSEGPICSLIWEVGEKWPVRYASENSGTVLGYSPEELTRPTFFYADIVHPDDLEALHPLIMGNLENGIDTCELSYRLRQPEGHYVWFYDLTRVLRNADGSLRELRGYIYDQSEQKRLAEELERKEERFRLLFESHPDGTLLVEATTGRITFFNRVAYERLGYSAEEFGQMHMEDLEEFKSAEEWELRLDRIRRRGGDDYETVHRCRDGATLDIYTTIRGVRLEGKPFLLCVLRDISHYKQLEQGLRRQVALNRSLLDSMPDVIFFKDLDGRYIGANQPFLDLVGKEGLEVLGDTDYELFEKQVADLFREHDLAMLESGQSRTNEEQVVYPDGSEVWLETLKSPLRDTDGSVMGLIGIGRNMTERKAMEDRLRESDEMLQKLSVQVPGFIYQFQLFPDGRMCLPFASEGIRSIYEVEAEEAQADAQAILDRFHPEDAEMVTASIQKSAETLDRWEMDYRVILPKKGQRWLRGVANPEKLPDGSVLWHGYISDITDRKFSEKVLRDKTEELDRYFNSSLDLLCIATLDGRFLRLNPMWQEVLGYKASELEGMPFVDLVHPDDIAATLEAVSEMGEGEMVLSFENRYRAQDGTYRWIEWRSRPVDGLIYAVARDITSRRAAEDKHREQARILEFILEDVLAGYWDWQVLDNREYYSPKLLAVLGRADEPTPTTPEAWQRWIDPEDLPKVLANFQEHQSSQGKTPYRSEVRFHKPDGSVIWILCVGQIIEWTGEGLAKRMIGVHLEVTERKRAELELERTNQQLNQTIAQADSLRHQAEEASRAKSAFLATMSHEIRTPMNAVIGMTSLIQSTELTDEQREFASTIQKSGQALLALINDILDFSKIEAGQLTLEDVPFDLEDCVVETLDLCSSTARTKNLEIGYFLEKGTPEQVLGDVARLKQVLINLVGNAVKFTEKGEVNVQVSSIHRASAEGWRIRFEVQDTGIGMDEAAREKLFRPFSQGDSSVTRRFGGTGLGLTISKRIVEAMGGEIGVRSEPGKGSIFFFEVELGLAAIEPTVDVTIGQLKALPTCYVLVLEDHTVHQKFLRQQFEGWGFQVEMQSDAAEAAKTLRERRPDLIVAAHHLPRIDGDGLARRARMEFGDKCPPILLLTAVEGAVEAKAGDAVLTKPVKSKWLLDRVLHLLGHKNHDKGKSGPTNRPRQAFDAQLAHDCPLSILVCEDNVVNQRVIGHMLKRFGYEPLFAADGIEGLEVCERQPVDLIFLDLQMPRMGGLEMARTLREEQKEGPKGMRCIHIAALTAAAMQEDRVECLEAGMDYYLSKPVQTHRLEETIRGTWAALDRTVAGPTIASHLPSPATEPTGTEECLLDEEQIEALISFGEAEPGKWVVVSILEDFQTSWEAVRRELEGAEGENLARVLHKLKGASRSIGLTTVGALAEEKEREILKSAGENTTGAIPSGADLVPEFHAALLRNWALLNARLQKDGIPPVEFISC